MKTFNIAIIGYGGFGKFLHNGWNKIDSARVTAVVDQDAGKMQGLEGIKTFTNWRDILNDKDIDLVAIVTEPSSHEMIATACMEAGKHVLIEKPLAITLADAQKIIEVRDKTGMVAGIDFIMRFNPLLQSIKSLTQKEVFGKLRRVDVENYAQDQQLPQWHWFWDHDLSGGILIEHAVHFIDLVHFISPSKVLSVNGLKHNRNPIQEDQIMANVLYEDGLIATHYHSFARPGFFEKTSIKLSYDLADIELHGWIPLEADIKVLVNVLTKQTLLSSPFFELGSAIPVESASDESRPAGWGTDDNTAELPNAQESHPTSRRISSGGIDYVVEEVLTGRLELGRSKQEVYTSCIQASLFDVMHKIKTPAYKLTAPLEAGLASLEVAVRATESARRES